MAQASVDKEEVANEDNIPCCGFYEVWYEYIPVKYTNPQCLRTADSTGNFPFIKSDTALQMHSRKIVEHPCEPHEYNIRTVKFMHHQCFDDAEYHKWPLDAEVPDRKPDDFSWWDCKKCDDKKCFAPDK